MDFLKNIHNKPEKERKKIMYFLVAVCGAFIFFTWLVLLPRIIEKNKLKKPDVLKQSLAEAGNSISKYNFGEFKDIIKKTFGQKNKGQENTEEKIIETERLPVESQEQENKRTQEQNNK